MSSCLCKYCSIEFERQMAFDFGLAEDAYVAEWEDDGGRPAIPPYDDI